MKLTFWTAFAFSGKTLCFSEKHQCSPGPCSHLAERAVCEAIGQVCLCLGASSRVPEWVMYHHSYLPPEVKKKKPVKAVLYLADGKKKRKVFWFKLSLELGMIEQNRPTCTLSEISVVRIRAAPHCAGWSIAQSLAHLSRVDSVVCLSVLYLVLPCYPDEKRSWFLDSLSIMIMPGDGSNGQLKSQNRKCVILRSGGIRFCAHISDRQIMLQLNIVPCPSLGSHKVGWQRSGYIDCFSSSCTICSLQWVH